MTNETNNRLYYREGQEFTGKPEQNEKGKPVTSHIPRCGRCGGQGGAEQWKHTGWTCFECGGSGKGSVVIDRLYTAEQLAKLNATRDKKQAKKDAARAEKQAALEAERNARRDSFKTENAELFANAASLNDEFVNTMIAQCIDRVSISPRQIELINSKITDAARKAVVSYVGEVGERREFTCTLITFRAFDSKFGRSYLHVMRDEQGNTIKYMGSSMLGNVTWEGKYDSSYPVWDKAEVFTFTATVKAHEEYNGDKQTVVARPKQEANG